MGRLAQNCDKPRRDPSRDPKSPCVAGPRRIRSGTTAITAYPNGLLLVCKKKKEWGQCVSRPAANSVLATYLTLPYVWNTSPVEETEPCITQTAGCKTLWICPHLVAGVMLFDFIPEKSVRAKQPLPSVSGYRQSSVRQTWNMFNRGRDRGTLRGHGHIMLRQCNGC